MRSQPSTRTEAVSSGISESASSGRWGWRRGIWSMAPMALSSVAPNRRASSRTRLAEKRGSRTSPAPAATEPRTEQAGALMRNSGNDVTSRSSTCRPIHQGNPSPAIT